eukprot:scaffold289289_cov19-Prasinocladus_malaysianus.AAC.1
MKYPLLPACSHHAFCGAQQTHRFDIIRQITTNVCLGHYITHFNSHQGIRDGCFVPGKHLNSNE